MDQVTNTGLVCLVVDHSLVEAGATGHPRGGHYAYNHQYRIAPGSGGSPGYHRSRRGARGMAGIVCVWNFR